MKIEVTEKEALNIGFSRAYPTNLMITMAIISMVLSIFLTYATRNALAVTPLILWLIFNIYKWIKAYRYSKKFVQLQLFEQGG